MLTVRFPNGYTVQYNDAHTCTYEEHVMILSKDKRAWVATIPYARRAQSLKRKNRVKFTIRE